MDGSAITSALPMAVVVLGTLAIVAVVAFMAGRLSFLTKIRQSVKRLVPTTTVRTEERRPAFVFFDSVDEFLKHSREDPRQPVAGLFYSEGCSHCHDYQPTFMQEAERFRDRGLDYALISMDKEQPATWHQMGIKGVPTVLIFKNGAEVGRVPGSKRALGDVHAHFTASLASRQ